MRSFRKALQYPLSLAAFCLVLLSFSEIKGHAQLGPPPTIVVQPLGISVLNGGTAIFTTTALNVSSLKWMVNGQPVPASNSSVLTVDVPLVGDVSTLTVNNVSSASAGNYTVKFTNLGGSVTSSTAPLIVVLSVVTNVVDFVASGTGKIAAGFKLQLSAPVGSNVVVQASTDLSKWTSLATNTATSGGISYTDTAANSFSFRYYRAKIQ